MNFLRLSSRLMDLGTGKPPFVGEAIVEAKLTDAITGDVLGASVDDRVGTMSLSASKFDSWGAVHKALEYWAKQARFRLCKGRGEDNCIHPEN